VLHIGAVVPVDHDLVGEAVVGERLLPADGSFVEVLRSGERDREWGMDADNLLWC
jgi:hypothetical protein